VGPKVPSDTWRARGSDLSLAKLEPRRYVRYTRSEPDMGNIAVESRWVGRSYTMNQVASLFGSSKLAIIHGVPMIAMQCLMGEKMITTILDIP
jgi:hypothetical protein